MDRDAMRAAIADFLTAAGADLSDPHLARTPEWVAEAWADELLRGEGVDLGEILRGFEAPENDGAVILTGVPFVGVCPHHLLPYLARAHLAYVPKDRIVGFSKLVRLVETAGARLALQEEVAATIADALMAHLRARGAMVVLEAKQACMALRGVRRHEATVTCTALRGVFSEPGSPHPASLLSAIDGWRQSQGGEAR